jgi:RNA 2',3'-cyclic 3'-phosphodiesterase
LIELPADKIRAFVALGMSAEIESAIMAMVDTLRAQRSGIRWVGPLNLHLTLRFLGDAVERKLLVALDKILNEIAMRTSLFVLNAVGTGAFPNLDRPRTIWVGMESEPLVGLAQQIEDAAVKVGCTPEGRPYKAHLTIGRVRDLHGWARIRDALQRWSTQDFGRMLASEMTLYRSTLGGKASQYDVLAHYRFSAQP